MRLRLILLVLLAVAACDRGAAQTRLDLRSQARNVDFRNAASTSPVKSGTLLPPVCTAGEMFLKLDGAPGTNLYTCTATDTWQSQGDVSAALDVQAGTGIVTTSSTSDGRMHVQTGVDTAIVQTKANAQSGETIRCAATTANGLTYQCSLLPTLTGYKAGMVIHWIPASNGAGGTMTLNIDGLGALAVRAADGTSNVDSGAILAHRMYPIWYDGTVFRLMQDTAYNPTALSAGAPSGEATRCAASTNDGLTYHCGLVPAITEYKTGMVIHWVPAADSTGDAMALNIDGRGAVAVRANDGMSNLRSGVIVAARMYPLWYDGTVFRLMHDAPLDTSALQTKVGAQSGETIRCAASTNDGLTYNCSLLPALTEYKTGMVIHWVPAADSTGAAMALNIDGRGAVAVRANDGISNLRSGVIVAARMYPLWYDGTVFRLMHDAPLDTSALQTKVGAQSGETIRCAASTNDGLTYNCNLLPALTEYKTGMVIHWVPAADSTGAAMALNIDGRGAVAVRANDGISNLRSGVIVAARMYPLWYDGTVFRLMQDIPQPAQREIGFILCASQNCAVNDTITVPRLISSVTAGKLTKVIAALGTAPAGSNLTVDLKIGGSTTATVTIAAGQTTGSTTTFSSTSVAEGDLLSVQITGVGSTAAGRDMHLIAVVQ